MMILGESNKSDCNFEQLNDSIVMIKSPELGKGATGEVYQGFNKQTSKNLAIKFIPLKIYRNYQSKIDREIEIMMMFANKPESYILKCFGHDRNAKGVYLYLELCKTDLQKQMERQPKMKIKRVEKILWQLFQALLHLLNLHGQDHKIIHRDIKPANVLLDYDGNVKLTDFALCRQVKNSMTSGVGTPCYIAPEVASNSYSDKCDVWSLGVMTYQLLWGMTPFSGSEKQKKFDQLIFPPESRIVGNHWVKLLTKMLAYDQNERWNMKQAQQYFLQNIFQPQVNNDRPLMQSINPYRSEMKQLANSQQNSSLIDYDQMLVCMSKKIQVNKSLERIDSIKKYCSFLQLKCKIFAPVFKGFAVYLKGQETIHQQFLKDFPEYRSFKNPYRVMLLFLSMSLIVTRLSSILSWLKNQVIELGDGQIIDPVKNIDENHQEMLKNLKDAFHQKINQSIKSYTHTLNNDILKKIANYVQREECHLILLSSCFNQPFKLLKKFQSGSLNLEQSLAVYNKFINQLPIFIPNAKVCRLSDQDMRTYLLMRLLPVVDKVIPNSEYQQKMCQEFEKENLQKQSPAEIRSRIQKINQLPPLVI